jgi:hypothetical protein
MFTHDDEIFLTRLGARTDATLASADSSTLRLEAAIDQLRGAVVRQHAVDHDSRASIEALLDEVWWATSQGDRNQARVTAARLAHEVRGLRLPGMRAMRAVDAAQRIRTLVVLAA